MWVDKVIIGVVFAVILIGLWLWNVARENGKIVIRRKPKIKLNEICRKYYDKCEKLLFPISHHYTLYHHTLSVVEETLKKYYSQYQYNLMTGQRYPYQDYYHDMFKEVNLFYIDCWSSFACKDILSSALRTTLVTDEGEILDAVKQKYEDCINSPNCPISFLDAWEEYEILEKRSEESQQDDVKKGV